MQSSPNIVYALDFDGVICDSVTESSQTALKAAAKQWPHLAIPTSPFPPHMLTALRDVRPVIETGFENVLLARLVADTTAHTADTAFVQPVLREWQTMRDRLMQEWAVTKDELVECFGSVRDEWIESDLNSWIDANRL